MYSYWCAPFPDTFWIRSKSATVLILNVLQAKQQWTTLFRVGLATETVYLHYRETVPGIWRIKTFAITIQNTSYVDPGYIFHLNYMILNNISCQINKLREKNNNLHILWCSIVLLFYAFMAENRNQHNSHIYDNLLHFDISTFVL